MPQNWQGSLEKIDEYRWRIPKSHKAGMKVPCIIYADEALLKDIKKEKALEQVANVAFLPGIVKHSLAMPDIHWGYGFSIGGVAATDPEDGGVISPGGVGYDINCGIRLVRTNLMLNEVKPKIRDLVMAIFRGVPCGVGVGGDIKISHDEEKKVFTQGSKWAVKAGYGRQEDLEHTESGGCMEGADPASASPRAYERGKGQVGTLGSGNHFFEVQVVDEIYDEKAAEIFRLKKDQIVVMLHSGSRGFGYQICDDYIRELMPALAKYNISIPDRQLVCAPVNSQEGQAYLAAMKCAANYAWANRQVLMHLAREIFERFFQIGPKDLGMDLIYDVAHNIAKMESHKVDGKEKVLCVHRKGATRAFPPGHPEIPVQYKSIGQPVIIPGDMGRNSYLLVGREKAAETWYSTCHGAGRVMSRGEAIRSARGRSIKKELEDKGIIAMAKGRDGLDEEQPAAYKDVNEVVNVVHGAGLSKKVCRMRPMGVIKG